MKHAKHNRHDPRAGKRAKRARRRLQRRKKVARKLAPTKWWLYNRYRAIRKKKRVAPNKPGFVRKCVVTGKDRSKYEAAHIQFLKAKGNWKHFKKDYAAGKLRSTLSVKKRVTNAFRWASRARERARKARKKTTLLQAQMTTQEPLLLQRLSLRRVRQHMRGVLRARRAARKARLKHPKARRLRQIRERRHKAYVWKRATPRQRAIIRARRMGHAARYLRERARKARYQTTQRAHQVKLRTMRILNARYRAREARVKLQNERKNKNHARCLHWIWWPRNPKNHHWYRYKKFSQVAEFARRAWRRKNGYNASTPRMDFGPKSKAREWMKAYTGYVHERLMRNVLFLKAMALAVHDKMRSARKGNSQLSAIGTFMWRYGIRKDTRNAYGEYKALAIHYSKFYKAGIGKYIMVRLVRSMRHGNGIVTKERHAVYLNHKALGLKTRPSIFDKWSCRRKVYNRLLKHTAKLNGRLLTAVKGRQRFVKDKCMCSTAHLPNSHRFKRFGICTKHFAYDKKPWCIVNWTCKKAALNKGLGFKWRSC